MYKRKFVMRKIAFILILLMMITACEKELFESNDFIKDPNSTQIFQLAPGEVGRYIVRLSDDFIGYNEVIAEQDNNQRKQVMTGYLNRYLRGHNVVQEQVEHIYTNVFPGFSAKLNTKQLDRLLNDPMVTVIEMDREIGFGKPPKKPKDPKPPPVQFEPWGVGRVGGPGDGTGATAWVIDSGIDLDHPDLNVDVDRSRSFVVTDRKRNPDDQHGHGTHVAGTIAAIDNSYGVVGVAAGATVVSYRVLDRKGRGYVSWAIAALDELDIAGEAGDAVNMSLGPASRYTNQIYDDAVIAVADKGLFVSIAAGNEEDDAIYYSPARVDHPNVYTISAMDINDNFAYFSNYGSPVDYCAPGVYIESCYKGGEYAIMSGTSMAAPHVAGLLLLGQLNSDGTVNNDPDGDDDPIAHR